jgi:hypothetical protein
VVNREYRCNKCGTGGVKLWRDYGTPFHWDLWCVDCACAADPERGIDPATVREDGTRISETHVLPKRGNRSGLITGVATFKGEVVPRWLNEDFELKHDVTDQLGWYVPAIPVDAATDHEAPEAYWGYTSVDMDDGRWWRDQPLRAAVLA